MLEQTFFLIKPDAVERQLVGEILRRAENKGLQLVALELRHVSTELAEEHYGEHEGKPFYPALLDFITSGPVVAGVFEGESAIAAWRQLAGSTDPLTAEPGSIRGDYCLITRENAVHGSDSVESARHEIATWFPDLEILEMSE